MPTVQMPAVVNPYSLPLVSEQKLCTLLLIQAQKKIISCSTKRQLQLCYSVSKKPFSHNTHWQWLWAFVRFTLEPWHKTEPASVFTLGHFNARLCALTRILNPHLTVTVAYWLAPSDTRLSPSLHRLFWKGLGWGGEGLLGLLNAFTKQSVCVCVCVCV